MGKYVEKNLNKNETIIKKADISSAHLVVKWIAAAIVSIFFLLLYSATTSVTNATPDIFILGDILDSMIEKAAWVVISPLLSLMTVLIIYSAVCTLRHFNIELAVTSSRIIGKYGIVNTNAIDATLEKIDTVSTHSNFLGKIFNYGKVRISVASKAGSFEFEYVKDPEAFKRFIMEQVDLAQQRKMEEQARLTQNAFAANNVYPNNPYPYNVYPNNPYPNQPYPNQHYPNQHYPNQHYPNQPYPNQQYPNYPQQSYPYPNYPNNNPNNAPKN